jgi:hypothetical protein
VNSIAGKVVLFIDACHSGNVMGENGTRSMEDINKAIIDQGRVENGAVTFTSSTVRSILLKTLPGNTAHLPKP